MNSRTDRQDAMNMIAHSTNIQLTYEPGVNHFASCPSYSQFSSFYYLALLPPSSTLCLTRIQQVNGKEIHNNARPESSGGLSPAQLGCWRAHANLWSRMLTEGISTALIVEDDADWDVNVHDSFALMSQHLRGSNVLRGRDLTEYERESTPYGAFQAFTSRLV